MPRYDYLCETCGEQYEARHGYDDPPPPCPNGHTNVHKLITSAPRMLLGMAAPASKNAGKEELRQKWGEETPKLREKLVKKLGEETVKRSLPNLNANYD
jgi:putative FmdB family regulatory protein